MMMITIIGAQERENFLEICLILIKNFIPLAGSMSAGFTIGSIKDDRSNIVIGQEEIMYFFTNKLRDISSIHRRLLAASLLF